MRATAIRLLQLVQVGEGARILEFPHDRRYECLLPVGAVQIPVFQAVALPDERQRLGSIQPLLPGREVGAGIRVVDSVIQAHIHPAQGLGQVVETRQVDLGEVVDRNAGQAAHRPQGCRTGGFAALGLEFFLAVACALVDQLLRDVLLGEPVGLFDLDVVVSRDAIERHPVVAWDRKSDHFVVGADMHENQGVGVVAAVVGIARMQLLENRPGQVVAVLVFSGVQSDEQDIDAAAVGSRIFRAQRL